MSIREIQVGEELRKCENRGYDCGFHSSFLKKDAKYKVILICPECVTRYNIGWYLDL